MTKPDGESGKEPERLDEPPKTPDAADGRMADLLASGRASGELRRQLEQTETPESEDLLQRINALDFLNGVVGDAPDMPERLGDYRITGLLGRGGMGTVYLAWQEELDREVALKVLSPSWVSDPTMRQRFRAEARATAALHHRHIVPIYGYGESQGRLYFAMERVDGTSLDKHIAAAQRQQKPPMEPMEASRRFAGVADALGLAHRRRLLHRDVKPGNILVAADGTFALTDFGLAKALDQNSMRLTSKSGGFLGTLHYTSPEQAMGRDLSAASDLYSLGVTMFEAVTGELPLTGKTTENALHQVLYGTPRRLRDVLPKAPRDLDAVIEKLLRREPSDRYQDGEELARDLQRIADGEPVHIRRLPIHVRIARRIRKNPVLSGAIFAACALLVLSFVLLRSLRVEKGQSLQSRHQNNLVAAANAVRAEMGSPWGPAPLLQCLTGGSIGGDVATPTTLASLQRTVAEMPEDEVARRMLDSYESDPLPEASELLARGMGYEALSLYDAAVGRELEVRAFTDLSVDIRLYRLYLGRACANLTASVMRDVDARRDLDLASFLRPGAVFPRALATALDIAESEDPMDAIERTDRDLRSASPERRAVVGRLLWTMAGLRPASDSNLMPFSLPWRARTKLMEVAKSCIDAAPQDTVSFGQATGRARELQQSVVYVLANLGEATSLVDIGERMRAAVQQSVHPQSELQGYLGAMQLLERPRSTAPLVDAFGQPMSAALELASWRVVAKLSPPRAQMERLRPRFERFVDEHPELEGLVPLAAQLLLAAGSERAASYTRSWIATDPSDPEALRCRLTLALRQGDLSRALDDAMAFVQRSADRADALEEVLRLCRECASLAPIEARQGIASLGQRFAEIAR